MDQYTHEFKFQLGDGGKFIEGEIEFDTDNKASFKITSWSEPIPAEFMQDFITVMEDARLLYEKYTDIKLIKIKKK
jgi:hypothetical protein